MSEPLSTNEIEDVVSSVRRLVSPEARPRTLSRDLGMDRLILTPSLRIVAEQPASGPTVVKLETVARKPRVTARKSKPAKLPVPTEVMPSDMVSAAGADESAAFGPAAISLAEMALQAEDAEVIAVDDSAAALPKTRNTKAKPASLSADKMAAKVKSAEKPASAANANADAKALEKAVAPKVKSVAKPPKLAKPLAEKSAVEKAAPIKTVKAKSVTAKPAKSKIAGAKPDLSRKANIKPATDFAKPVVVAETMQVVPDAVAGTVADEPVLLAPVMVEPIVLPTEVEAALAPIPADLPVADPVSVVFPEGTAPVAEDSQQGETGALLTDGQGNPISILDEDELMQMLRRVIREELQGVLGEKITRNVRKLVRAEIARALTAQTLD